MFETGSYVVYGYNGICKVTDVTKMSVPGSAGEKEYYVLEPVASRSGKVFVPVGGNKVALRRIMTKEEAESFIEQIPSIEPLDVVNDKHREEEYKKVMMTCECEQWIRIIKALYLRRIERQEKGLSVTAVDNRYWKAAEGYLYTELAIALGKKPEEMEEYITQKIA